MLLTALAVSALALALVAPAGAQSRPRPDDPAVKAPPLAQPSAYEGYRPFREEEMVPWVEVNDEVRRLGGHMGHMKDETSPAAARSPAPAAGETQRRGNTPGGPKHAH